MNKGYYDTIKQLLINNEIAKKAKDLSKNKSELETYYNVGKQLFNAGKEYGENIVKQFSEKLYKDTGLSYSVSYLRKIRQFYQMVEKGADVPRVLSWTHYQELLSIDDINKINYYIKIYVEQGINHKKLREKIKSKEYERLDKETRNKLIKKEIKEDIADYIKHPIIIKSNNIKDKISEKFLKQIILEDMPSFLKELGQGFSFIDSEYKITVDNRNNYIDLLLYNYIYNAFVVVELKITELKKEHIGQIQVYMNYIDRNIKQITQDKTIGIIICKRETGYVIEYSSDPRIYATSYVLK